MNLIESLKKFGRSDEDEDMTSAWLLPEHGSRRSSDREVSIRTTASLRVTIAQPKRLEDVPGVADQLKTGITVVLNMEGVERNMMCRILDILSGVTYSLGATISRIAENTFMIVPFNVELEGGLMDALTNSGVFDSEREIHV